MSGDVDVLPGRLRTLFAFLYDFIVGDDPLMAVLVVVALGATAAVAGAGVAAWWIAPVVIVAALAYSTTRV